LRILSNLVKEGYLIKGNYNKIAYDRTTWYAISEIVESMYENREIHFTKRGNGSTQTVSPIPDNKTHIENTYTTSSPEVENDEVKPKFKIYSDVDEVLEEIKTHIMWKTTTCKQFNVESDSDLDLW